MDTTEAFLAIVIVSVVGVAVNSIVEKIAEQKKVNAMSPDESLNYVFGAANVHLVCPHCQTIGKVHVKKVKREVVSTGTVGGILKTNTRSTTEKSVTQHHCNQCESTWDI